MEDHYLSTITRVHLSSFAVAPAKPAPPLVGPARPNAETEPRRADDLADLSSLGSGAPRPRVRMNSAFRS